MNTTQHLLRLCLLASLSLTAVACGGSAETGTASAAQIDQGMTLFAASCAGCHGADGSGGTAPAVVGDGVFPLDAPAGAVRDVQFKNAGDVYRWAKVNMPASAPGSLTDAEYLAIMAFDLFANNIELGSDALTEAKADSIVLNP